MERLKVFKIKKGLTKLITIFGVVMLVLGIVFLVRMIAKDTGFDPNAITFTLQGIVFIAIGFMHSKTSKYYIEWDDKQMNYLLPDSDQMQTVLFSDIQSIEIHLFEIHLKLQNGEKTIRLENVQFEEVKAIKNKFEEIKTSVNN